MPAAAPLDRTRLAAARLRAADLHPFLALALYALTPIADPDSGTFGVDDRWRLYIDPAALQAWSIEHVAGVLLHEVSHVIRDHAGRARTLGVDPESKLRWNLAADAEINDDLLLDGIALPPTPVTPRRLGQEPHRAAEHYYHRLETERTELSTPDCGPGCHGLSRRDNLHPGDLHPPGLSEFEALLLRRRIAVAIIQHQAQQPGTMSGGWVRWAEALLQPQLDWRRLLSGHIRRAVAAINGSADYTYRRPSRRQLPDVVLPALHRPIPSVAIIVDTSGSITAEQLGAAWTEVHGCLRAIGTRRDLLTVYATDTTTTLIKTTDHKRVALTGGGGTDLRHGINQALTSRPPPDLLVVLTDGFTPWPARKPRSPIIIGLLHGPHPPPAAPAWAQVVPINTASPAQTRLPAGR